MDDFAEKYREKVNLPFMCNVRPDLISERTAETLRYAGCYSVWIGVECGDERISRELLRRNISNSDIMKACRLLRAKGIKYATQNLIALPVDNSLETDLKTLELNIRCKPDFAWSSIFYPYSRIYLGDYSREKGYLDKEFDDMSQTNKVSSELNFKDTEVKKTIGKAA